MKIVVIPNNKDINKYIKVGAQAFIFGLKKYSSGFKYTISIEEIKEVRTYYKGELFISINKNLFNNEIKEIEKLLLELDKLNITGILFYDLAIINIKKRLNIKTDLVWNQTHMVTNYDTCNYYYNKGVKYGVISSELTLEEINEITNNTKMKLFLNIFGYQSMAFSRRSLLTNYSKSINKEISDEYVVTNLNEDYIIREEESGTNFLSNKILNGSIYLDKINIEYLIFNSEDIEEELILNVLNLYNKLILTKDVFISENIDKLVGKYRGFFEKKTIYRVKK